MLQFPNRVAQAGVFYTGSPAYVDVSAGSPSAGMVTFAAKAADDSWADGDTVGVLVAADDENYWVGTGTWDATNEYIELTTEEDAVGTLSDGDAVTASAVLTSGGIAVVMSGVLPGSVITPSAGTATVSLTGRYYTLTPGEDIALDADSLPTAPDLGFAVLRVTQPSSGGPWAITYPSEWAEYGVTLGDTADSVTEILISGNSDGVNISAAVAA